MEVIGPKGPDRRGGADLLTWAGNQLRLAGQIIDNPGGGLLFATQTIGQVKAGLAESGDGRWRAVVAKLERAEDHAVRREPVQAKELLRQALDGLGRG